MHRDRGEAARRVHDPDRAPAGTVRSGELAEQPHGSAENAVVVELKQWSDGGIGPSAASSLLKGAATGLSGPPEDRLPR